jgi:hypothetical protein
VVIYLVPSEDVLCRAISDELGKFTCETENPLDDGDYNLQALASDALENESEPSALIAFTISTGSIPDGDVDADDDQERDTDILDADETDGDALDGDKSDNDLDGDLDADQDIEIVGGGSGCSGCQATGGNCPSVLLVIGLLVFWLRRRVYT